MNVYDRISANRRSSVMLIILFLLIIWSLGYFFDIIFGFGSVAIVIATIFALISISISYFIGDQLVLAIHRAVPASKKDNAQLLNIVEELSIAAGIPKPKVYIIEDAAINAFATGRNPKHASIAVTRGALEKLNRDELQGVIAHELSHIKNYDMRFMTLVALLVGVVGILANWLLRGFFWFGPSRRDRRENEGGFILMAILGLVFALISVIAAQLIKFAISRRREFLADADAALMTRYPKGLANALRKIAKDEQVMRDANPAVEHMYFSNPFKKPNWFLNLFSTHPPIEDRIKALESM
ncbi:MAG: M48 family metallopeptidase [Candidatus Woesearchaeota archaeon]